MRITSRQLRLLIREELIREAQQPNADVREMQRLLGMSTSDQDGLWGPRTEQAWRDFVMGKMAGRKAFFDSDGYLSRADAGRLLDDWVYYAPRIAGGTLGQESTTGRGATGAGIPKNITGDAKGALEFVKFLSKSTVDPTTRFPARWWFKKSDDPARSMDSYPGFSYDSLPSWMVVRTWADPVYEVWPKSGPARPKQHEDEVTEEDYYDFGRSPADLLADYENMASQIRAGKRVELTGSSSNVDAYTQAFSDAYFWPMYIDNMPRLKAFFKKK